MSDRRRTLLLMALCPGLPTFAVCAALVIVAPSWPMVGAALVIAAVVAVAAACGFRIVGDRREHVYRFSYPDMDTVEMRFWHYMLVLWATIIVLAPITVIVALVGAVLL